VNDRGDQNPTGPTLPHEDDEVYIVLEGTGVLDVEGQKVELREGHALFVPAHAEHRFSGYESLSLLVIFERAPPRG
jgi:mannose-6-phosphate isomerase-like protein (cupin superfamily)